MKTFTHLIFLCSLIVLTVHCSREPQTRLRMPAVFSDHMVLQRNVKIPIWGKAVPGSTIQVQLDTLHMQAVADADSNWRVNLPPLKAGGPVQLLVSGPDSLRFNDVLIGDVWLASGQSNMNMPLAGWGRVRNWEKEIATADYSQIRLFQVEQTYALQPQWDLPTAGWKRCSPKSVAEFSATAYFFARQIYQKTSVPIGVVHSSSGGTPVEAWTSKQVLEQLPETGSLLKRISEATAQSDRLEQKSFKNEFKNFLKTIDSADSGFTNKLFRSDENQFASWPSMQLPQPWEKGGLNGFNGVVWFSRTITLDEKPQIGEWVLELGPTDDYDQAWINGRSVGISHSKLTPTVYAFSEQILKAGTNTLTVRVVDLSSKGGIWGRPYQLFLQQPDSKRLSLVGNWHYRATLDLKTLPKAPKNPKLKRRATVLFNGMIHPLIPFALKGFIWYQGESNAKQAELYAERFKAMIGDWRRRWAMGDLPFLYVQLAGYYDKALYQSASSWAELREAQRQIRELPATAMATAIDIGNEVDVHPKNKQEVGRRLALLALRDVYGQRVIAEGPRFDSVHISGLNVNVSFKCDDPPLTTSDGKPVTGFVIAGVDGRFYPSIARLGKTDVLLSAPQVKQPQAVRYAWANNPIANLTDGSGLPVTPFRTDAQGGQK